MKMGTSQMKPEECKQPRTGGKLRMKKSSHKNKFTCPHKKTFLRNEVDNDDV